MSAVELDERESCCLRCQKPQSLATFSRLKGKIDGYRNICRECECSKQQERHARLETYRASGRQKEREEQKQQAWERSMALRQAHELHQRERETWYRQQPDRCCCTCGQILPATAFGGASSRNGFVLQTSCTTCHEALRVRLQLTCCLCQEKTPHRDFLSRYDGYALCGNGTWISLYCKGCEAAFCTLPISQQREYIHTCCQRTFPGGQVIYAEVDPETEEIRYIGRTGRPQRRHAQHLVDVSPTPAQWGSGRKAWYTRGNWIYALSEKGLQPSMHILRKVEVSPLVVEWEQRLIWHGIQQGWRLLNSETMDEELIARIHAAHFDFLQAPFELLVQQHFFSSHSLVAFLHKWH